MELADAACVLDSMHRRSCLASAVATTDGYMVAPSDLQDRPQPVRAAATPRRLVETGVAALLRDGGDPDVVARQLAEHLAGPPIDLFDYAVRDLDLTLPAHPRRI